MRITERFIFFCATPEVFSQWHPSPFHLNGVAYSCAEAYMMIQKARLFDDRAALRHMYEVNRVALESFGLYELTPSYMPDTANPLREHYRLPDYKAELEHLSLKKLLKARTHRVDFNWKRWSKTPSDLKDLGREVKNFDPDIWDAHAVPFVVKGNMAKFSQNDFLNYVLWKTTFAGVGGRRDMQLVEAAHYDKVWGIGMREGDEGVTDPANWKGRNDLGTALMMVRDYLFPKP